MGTGNGEGTIENPAGTVQAALNVAQPSDIVYVDFSKNPGIGSFSIPNKVSILSTDPIQRINTKEFGLFQNFVLEKLTVIDSVGQGLFIQSNTNANLKSTLSSNIITKC